MNKPNYYAIIPAEVRYSKKLTPNAKLLYAEITALCNMNGKCTASTDYFCRLYEVSRVSIQKWLKILEDNNYIKRINIYKPYSKQIEARMITLVNIPSKEKLIDNTNININNTNLTDSNISFTKRLENFYNEVFVCDYPRETLTNFYEYWTEQNKSKKMKFELCKTWNTKLRLKTWVRNSKKWDKPTMGKLHSQINEWQEAKKLL